MATDSPTGLAFTVPRRISTSLESLPPVPERMDLVTTTGRSPSSSLWKFPVHADCWALLTPRVDPAACALTLGKALASLNWNWSFPTGPASEHAGARYDLPRLLLGPSPAYVKTYHRRSSLQQPETFAGLVSELGIPLSFEDVLHALPRSNLPGLEPVKDLDIFDSLGEDVVLRMLCFVQTPDISALRLASRAVARLSRVDRLPQKFWASRFAMPEDGEESAAEQERDWCGLYFSVRRH